MIIIFWILLGGVIGFFLGLNHTEGATFVSNYRRMDLENQDLQTKVNKYKIIIKDLVESNKSLVKELNNVKQETKE